MKSLYDASLATEIVEDTHVADLIGNMTPTRSIVLQTYIYRRVSCKLNTAVRGHSTHCIPTQQNSYRYWYPLTSVIDIRVGRAWSRTILPKLEKITHRRTLTLFSMNNYERVQSFVVTLALPQHLDIVVKSFYLQFKVMTVIRWCGFIL